MARKGKPLVVRTDPSKEVVVDGLTRDVDVATCVFDLIDNGADAARETIFAGVFAEDRRVLPESYEGFQIDLTFSSDGLTVKDNCGGISVENLRSMVLRFGKRSIHDMGIGVFGVGLNRALFKLGRVSHLKTDTGAQRVELVLDTAKYLESEDWNLPAQEFASSGKIGTEIEIRKPLDDIGQQFADADWRENLRHEIGRRYGRFIAKKLVIRVNGIPANDEEVPIRDGGPYEGEYKFFKTDEGVAIHIQYGQHRDYRFTKEPDYDLARNSAITGEFGWTVFCNDRAIIISDRTSKTGWDAKFHTEFYGFVGNVNFVGSDPAKLPWDTTKTDVDLNNRGYRMALVDMRKFVEKWRGLAEERKKVGPPKPIPARPQQQGGIARPSLPPVPAPSVVPPPKPAPVIKPKPVEKADHNQLRTILPKDVDEVHCNDKHLKLVHEAKGLDLAEFTYAGLGLIRSLFESSVVTYLERHKKFDDIKQFAVDRRKAKGMAMPPDQIKRLVPDFEEMIAFLEKHPELWGAAKENYLRHSLRKMGAHQPMLNSGLHNPFQIVGAPKAFEIRDEVMPLLRHLIET